MKRIRAVLAAAVLVAGGMTAFASPASASRPACGTGAYSWAGAVTLGGVQHFEGVQGWITNRVPSLCSSDTSYYNDANAWVMMAPKDWPNGQGSGWAQMGIRREFPDGTCVRYFAQEAEIASNGVYTSLNEFQSSTCATIGARHLHWVKWDAACACMDMVLDNTLYLQTPFNPFNGLWQQPLNLQIYGEAYYENGSDLPGVASSRLDTDTIEYRSYVDDNWYTTCAAGPGVSANPLAAKVIWRGTGASRYSSTKASCDHIQSWTSTP